MDSRSRLGRSLFLVGGIVWPLILGMMIVGINTILAAIGVERLIVLPPPIVGLELVIYSIGIGALVVSRRVPRAFVLLAALAGLAGIMVLKTTLDSGWNIGYQRKTAKIMMEIDPNAIDGMVAYDAWGRRLQMCQYGHVTCLASLGADGVEGGEGYNADIIYCSDGMIYFDAPSLRNYLRQSHLGTKWGGPVPGNGANDASESSR